MREKKNDDKEIDEDKYFLLSLLPTLKSFNHDQKFDAKIEIMNVLHRIRRYGNMATPVSYTHLEYSDRKVKEKLWLELCDIFIPDYSKLEPAVKKEKGE